MGIPSNKEVEITITRNRGSRDGMAEDSIDSIRNLICDIWNKEVSLFLLALQLQFSRTNANLQIYQWPLNSL